MRKLYRVDISGRLCRVMLIAVANAASVGALPSGNWAWSAFEGEACTQYLRILMSNVYGILQGCILVCGACMSMFAVFICCLCTLQKIYCILYLRLPFFLASGLIFPSHSHAQMHTSDHNCIYTHN